MEDKLQQSIDMSKDTPIRCEKCENSTFKQTLLIRKMSALVSPSGQETVIHIGVFAFEKCNHVNKEFTKTSALSE